MYQYFATKGNVMEAVIALQSDLLDFADYGCRQGKIDAWINSL